MRNSPIVINLELPPFLHFLPIRSQDNNRKNWSVNQRTYCLIAKKEKNTFTLTGAPLVPVSPGGPGRPSGPYKWMQLICAKKKLPRNETFLNYLALE